jgi:hypothetical protein
VDLEAFTSVVRAFRVERPMVESRRWGKLSSYGRKDGMTNRMVRTTLVLGLALLLTACAAGVNPSVGAAAADGHVAGFWLGLWHGLICPITFLISLFTDDVNIYEVANNGNWYDFGFVIGVSSAFGGGVLGGRRGRRRG